LLYQVCGATTMYREWKGGNGTKKFEKHWSNLHYFRQIYTTMKTYQWTTWNSNRLLQGWPKSTASLGLIHTIYSDWIKPFDACVTEISIYFHYGWNYRCSVTFDIFSHDNFSHNFFSEVLMITSPLLRNVRHRAIDNASHARISQQGGQQLQGGHIFKYNIRCMQLPGGRTWNRGNRF